MSPLYSLKRIVFAASAAAALIFAMGGVNAVSATVSNTMTFTETNPGSGGPFVGGFEIDETLIGAGNENEFIPFSNFDAFSITLYGQVFDLAIASQPLSNGAFTNGAGDIDRFSGFFSNGFNELFLLDTNTWFYRTRAFGFCSSGQQFCDGTYDVAAVTTQAVPEPGALAILAIGLAGLGFARRRSSGGAVKAGL